MITQQLTLRGVIPVGVARSGQELGILVTTCIHCGQSHFHPFTIGLRYHYKQQWIMDHDGERVRLHCPEVGNYWAHRLALRWGRK